MSVKMLRHYHQIGLLEPADVDPHTGYRRYTADQIPIAQVVRRFRELDMPLDEIAAVLAAPDVQTRAERVATHLSRLEASLEAKQRAVASLRDLLAPGAAEAPDAAAGIELRSVPAVPAAAITEVVDAAEAGPWMRGAVAELLATLGAQDLAPAGPAGGIFADDLFTHHRGQSTVFVPCAGDVRQIGRVVPLVVPAAELAVITHAGPTTETDRAYGVLGAFVARHALGVDGPMREYYLVGRRETPDTALWRTEVGWPVFRVAARAGDPGAGAR
jgi:DNA-binding transcriptional MerR regulator